MAEPSWDRTEPFWPNWDSELGFIPIAYVSIHNYVCLITYGFMWLAEPTQGVILIEDADVIASTQSSASQKVVTSSAKTCEMCDGLIVSSKRC